MGTGKELTKRDLEGSHPISEKLSVEFLPSLYWFGDVSGVVKLQRGAAVVGRTKERAARGLSGVCGIGRTGRLEANPVEPVAGAVGLGKGRVPPGGPSEVEWTGARSAHAATSAEANPFRAGGRGGGEDEARGLETVFQQAWRLGSRPGALPSSRVLRTNIEPARTGGFQNGQQGDSEISDPTGKGSPTG